MKIWLKVPFSQKDDAKKLGARWSPDRKKWFVVNPDDLTPFMLWIEGSQQVQAGARVDCIVGRVIKGALYRDDGIERDWPPWEEGPDALVSHYSDNAIAALLKSL